MYVWMEQNQEDAKQKKSFHKQHNCKIHTNRKYYIRNKKMYMEILFQVILFLKIYIIADIALNWEFVFNQDQPRSQNISFSFLPAFCMLFQIILIL